MTCLHLAIIAGLLASSVQPGTPDKPLRFAWPTRGDATVELTDERSVGGETRSVVISMRLHVEPDGTSGRFVLRFSDAHIVSVDYVPLAQSDPTATNVAVARVMRSATPTMVIGSDGRYAESRDLDRAVREVIVAAGFPLMPPGLGAFKALLSDSARSDWNGWVGAWLGRSLKPGAWTRIEGVWPLDDTPVPVKVTLRGLPSGAAPGRTKLQATAVYPSKSVRRYAGGFLIDMARDAKELGDDDTVASARFLERAQFSPVTEKLTADLETATMRPLLVERERAFSAVADGHWVSGNERRTHRFTWTAAEASPSGGKDVDPRAPADLAGPEPGSSRGK